LGVGKFSNLGATAAGFTVYTNSFSAAWAGVALDDLGVTPVQPWTDAAATLFLSTGSSDYEINDHTGALIHDFNQSNNYGVLSVASTGNVYGCSGDGYLDEDLPAGMSGTNNRVSTLNGCLSGSTFAPDAFDGLGHLWEPQYAQGQEIGTLVEVNSVSPYSLLSPATYGYQGIGGPGAVEDGEGNPEPALITNSSIPNISGTAVDPSGNVWVLNGTADQGGNVANQILIEFVGLGAPTVTPTQLAVQYNTFTQLP